MRGNEAWHVAVLIPARDEQDLLPRCLQSIAAARRALPAGVSSDVIVVADRSRDDTAATAARMLGTHGHVLESDAGKVGCARALAAEQALARFAGPVEQCWLANTDADCDVPEDWLLRHLACARKGFAAVAGIVDVDTFAEHDAGVEQRFRLTYRIADDGSHPHVHGANLGVRADAYLSVGGWGRLATAEDHDLWGRLRQMKYRTVSDARLTVLTSGRRKGRAPVGFADALAAHNGVPA